MTCNRRGLELNTDLERREGVGGGVTSNVSELFSRRTSGRCRQSAMTTEKGPFNVQRVG